MAHLVVLFLFVGVLQMTSSNEETGLDKVISEVKLAYSDVITALNKQFPNTKEVSDKFVEQSREFTNNVKNLIENLKAEVGKNQDRLNSLFAKISDQLTEHIKSLAEIISPKAAASVDQVKEQLERTFSKVHDSVQKIVNAAKSEDITTIPFRAYNFTISFMDKFLNMAKVLGTSVETTFRETRRSITQLI